MDTKQDNIGDDNVIIDGSNSNRDRNIGSRNVIIGATDASGNTILNRPMVIGHNAKGSSNDIVIGAGANAGSELFLLLNQLRTLASKENQEAIERLISELNSPKKDGVRINKLWQSIKVAVTIGNAVDLIVKISPLIAPFLK